MTLAITHAAQSTGASTRGIACQNRGHARPGITPGFPTLTKTRRAPLFRRALVKGRRNQAPTGRPGRESLPPPSASLAATGRRAQVPGSAPRLAARDPPWAWVMAYFGATATGLKIGTVIKYRARKMTHKKIGYAASNQSQLSHPRVSAKIGYTVCNQSPFTFFYWPKRLITQ